MWVELEIVSLYGLFKDVGLWELLFMKQVRNDLIFKLLGLDKKKCLI